MCALFRSFYVWGLLNTHGCLILVHMSLGVACNGASKFSRHCIAPSAGLSCQSCLVVGRTAELGGTSLTQAVGAVRCRLPRPSRTGLRSRSCSWMTTSAPC